MCYCSGCDLYIYILHCFPHAQISFRSIPKNRDFHGSLLYEAIFRQYCAGDVAFNCLQQIVSTTVTRGLCLCIYLEYVPLSFHGEMLYRHLVVVHLVPSSNPWCFPYRFGSLVCLPVFGLFGVLWRLIPSYWLPHWSHLSIVWAAVYFGLTLFSLCHWPFFTNQPKLLVFLGQKPHVLIIHPFLLSGSPVSPSWLAIPLPTAFSVSTHSAQSAHLPSRSY